MLAGEFHLAAAFELTVTYLFAITGTLAGIPRVSVTTDQHSMPCPPRQRRFPLAALSMMVLLLLIADGSRLWAQDVVAQEEPTPSSVDEITTPIERSFIERIPRPGFFPWLKEQLKDAPPFFRDTKVDLNLRSFYFRRDKFDDSVSSAWAMGGALAYKSGWLLDRLQVGTTFYWSDNLYGPKDKDGTLLLKPGQHGYSVLGQLFGRVKLFDDHIVNLYRYEYNTPFIGKNDNRMTPNTFRRLHAYGIVRRQRRCTWFPLRRRLYHQDQRAQLG